MPPPPTITPLLVAELLVEGERWPVCVHVIDHPDARVLVDTGMTELRPELADFDPHLIPLSEQAFDLDGIDVVVNTHLHFDHCGSNHLFAGRPITLAWDELGGASATSRGHTGRTGGLTLHETFEVTLKVVGSRAVGFQIPAGISSFLPGFPSDAPIGAPYAPLEITMPRGDDFAAAVSARATGERRS